MSFDTELGLAREILDDAASANEIGFVDEQLECELLSSAKL